MTIHSRNRPVDRHRCHPFHHRCTLDVSAFAGVSVPRLNGRTGHAPAARPVSPARGEVRPNLTVKPGHVTGSVISALPAAEGMAEGGCRTLPAGMTQ
jgi:hypothetical protein